MVFRFYLILVDDFSRLGWFYPMKRKFDVQSIFPQVYIYVGKYIQSDSGGEFISRALKLIFNQYGIVHRISCP